MNGGEFEGAGHHGLGGSPGADAFLLLIVEDDPRMVQTLIWSLEALSSPERALAVEAVGTAAEGVDRLGKPPPIHATLLDIGLPNGEGLEVITRFVRAFPGVPIVVVSGKDLSEKDATSRGAMRFLQKPVSMDQLREAIADAMAARATGKVFAPADELLSEVKGAVAKLPNGK